MSEFLTIRPFSPKEIKFIIPFNLEIGVDTIIRYVLLFSICICHRSRSRSLGGCKGIIPQIIIPKAKTPPKEPDSPERDPDSPGAIARRKELLAKMKNYVKEINSDKPLSLDALKGKAFFFFKKKEDI